jgi:AcrR family transcriptional regulator
MGDRASTAPRRSQQERRDGTQRKRLEATLRCLDERGFARLPTTEIVRAAGVSQGTLYKHYPTKDELLSQAVELLFEELVTEYERA